MTMHGYYSAKLSGDRLRRCYELASPRVRQYLEAEIEFVMARLRAPDRVLELGCGYGRVAVRLAEVAGWVVGIDTSAESLILAQSLARSRSKCAFVRMDAVAPCFPDDTFDAIICVQNGISACAVEPKRLVRESLRLIRPGGRAMFSTYSEEFWPERIRWFESQAAAGLVGPIDYGQTGNGTVVGEDGFRVGTLSPSALRLLCHDLGVEPVITTVDASSVFCEIISPAGAP